LRFDAIVWDSGGTLFENPPQRRAADEPTAAEVWAKRCDRLAACLRALDLPVEGRRLQAALEKCEATVPAKHGQAYTFEKLMRALLERLEIPGKGEWACCMADAYAGPRYRSWLFDGVPEMLQKISEAGYDMHLAVNTAWCGFSMERAFQGCGILRYFRTRTYSGEVGLAKPDPRFFALVAERAGIAAKRILYVGDSIENDIRGAKGAGWSAALRCSEKNRASAHLADFVFTHSAELTVWLTGG